MKDSKRKNCESREFQEEFDICTSQECRISTYSKTSSLIHFKFMEL